MQRSMKLIIVFAIILGSLAAYYQYKKSQSASPTKYNLQQFWADLKALFTFKTSSSDDDDNSDKDDNGGKGGDKPPAPSKPSTVYKPNVSFKNAYLRNASNLNCANAKGGSYNDGDPMILYGGGVDKDCEDKPNNVWSYDGNNIVMPAAGDKPSKCMYISNDGSVVLRPCRDYQSIVEKGWWNWNPDQPVFRSGQQQDMCLSAQGGDNNVLKYSKCKLDDNHQRFQVFYGPKVEQHYNFNTK